MIGDVGRGKTKCKWRIEVFTKWLTPSTKVGALGCFRFDKRKNASINAANGNPRTNKYKNSTRSVSYTHLDVYKRQLYRK